MRLKQLLGVGLALPLLSALAVADSQLTGISVQTTGAAATVTIRANGSFTHNEYRPADNLLLVDFPGTGVGALDSSDHSVSAPGITSYQVHSYKAANGTDIARVELTLAHHTSVRFVPEGNALVLSVAVDSTAAASTITTASSPASTNAGSSTPTATPSAIAAKPPTAAGMSAQPVQVRGLSVVRGHDGTNVEIRSTGPLTPKVLTLKSPDRLVIDLQNAVPESKSHSIPVHAADLNMVRMAQFRADPPTTRVVLDLKSPQAFQLVSTLDKLTVELRPLTPTNSHAAPAIITTEETTLASASTPKGTAASVASVKPASARSRAPDYVITEAQYHPVVKLPGRGKNPGERASQAAKILGAAPAVEIPLSSGPAMASMKAEAMKTGMMQTAQQSAGNAQAVNAVNATANCNTGRYTGEPISVNLKDVDLKDFFRLIHEISGLNVVLDPGVNGTLTIVLDDVPWDQALAIVLQNNSLQCQLNGNVLRIALPDTLRKEADALRATQEAQALAVDRVTVTRYLSYAAAKNVVPTLKAFLSKRGDIIADDRTNSIIVQDIPGVIPGVDRLIKELDRKTQQVEIEARVVAATRTFARDIGAQFGFGYGNGPTAIGGAGAVGTSPLTSAYVNPPPYFTIPGVKPSTVTAGQVPATTSAAIPLFSNLPATGPTSGLSLLNVGSAYRLDLVLTAAEDRGLVKILSRPRVVTQNNAAALVRQGVRIPVVTAAQLGGPPTTTYIDAFLRLQVTPQITAENTVFLNVDIENTTPNFGVQVAGNPELLTQQTTTQVLVTDGGTVVIGGVIQTNDSISRNQVPFLGDIPILGNLFKHKAVNTNTQELIFFITPRIVESKT
jgi:type IV pilus secretin PilQ/predicted competence protein